MPILQALLEIVVWKVIRGVLPSKTAASKRRSSWIRSRVLPEGASADSASLAASCTLGLSGIGGHNELKRSRDLQGDTPGSRCDKNGADSRDSPPCSAGNLVPQNRRSIFKQKHKPVVVLVLINLDFQVCRYYSRYPPRVNIFIGKHKARPRKLRRGIRFAGENFRSFFALRVSDHCTVSQADFDGKHHFFAVMQLRHYKAALGVFSLKPSEEFQEFAELATFIAQVTFYEPVHLLKGSDQFVWQSAWSFKVRHSRPSFP